MTLLSRTLETPGDSGYKKEEEEVADRVKTGRESYQGVIPDEVVSCIQVGFKKQISFGETRGERAWGIRLKLGVWRN